MGQMEFVQGEINHNRFLMGVSIAIILSLFSFLFSNFESGNIYLLSGAGFVLVFLMGGLVHLQMKIKNQIKSLGDIKK